MHKMSLILSGLFFTTVVSADIAIELLNDAGMVSQAGSSVAVDEAFVQLIWSASAPVAQAGVNGALGAGEYLLYTILTTSTYEGTWSDQNAAIGTRVFEDLNVGGANINAGYFFVRIFDNSALGVDDYYLQQAQQGPSLTEFGTIPAPIPYDTNGQLGGALDSQGYQVIPEPAVASLIGIFGGGLLVFRRLFSKS